jgi:hypothetical protein
MTFILGILTGMLVTIGASFIIASDIDKDKNQF